MSQPAGTQPFRRNHSRNNRLIRLRTTAFPTFFVIVRPSLPRGLDSARGCASASTWRPWSFLPQRWTATKSTRRLSRISLPTPNAVRRGTLLLRDRDRDPFASLGATAAEDFTAAAGFLPGAEPVGALAALVVWLVRTLHGSTPPGGEGDRYSRARMKSSRRRARPHGDGFPTRSGVHFRAFSACNVNSRSDTNARFPRLWTSRRAWP